jgi:hypothetical protein
MQPQSNFVDVFTVQLWTISNCNSNKVTWNTRNFISSTIKPLYVSSRPQHSILIKFQLIRYTQEEILRQHIAPVLTQHHFEATKTTLHTSILSTKDYSVILKISSHHNTSPLVPQSTLGLQFHTWILNRIFINPFHNENLNSEIYIVKNLDNSSHRYLDFGTTS